MKQSAGLLLYRNTEGAPEFFLVHPGGPFFAKKDKGWWTIPKGEIIPPETPADAALREFEEETGHRPAGEMTELNPVTQKGGKQVLCWAVEGNLDPDALVSNTFEIEWPPKTGLRKSFPEIDRAGWFDYPAARERINERQTAFLDELLARLSR